MRNLIMLLFLPLSMWAVDKKNSNSLSPQTLSVQCPPNITIQEGAKYDTSVTGFPVVLSNSGGAVTITYIEIFSNGNCANGSDLVNRNFTIRNALGEIERCSQSIFIRHLRPDQLRIPTDTTIEYPKDKKLAEAILRSPLSLGSIEITFIDTKVSNLCNIPVRIKRDWSIRDKCSSTVIKKSTNITLMAYQNSFEHNKAVVGDVCFSEGEIVLTSKGEFGPYTYLWNNGATTNSLYGIPAGNYSVVVTDAFKCNNLISISVTSIAETADVGGLISTANNYRVNPDSIYISDVDNVTKFCSSSNGGLHYAFKVRSKKTGMIDYRFVKRSQVLDGVSTKDIVVIQKHILGKQKLTDTLRYFAADVNRNFNVTSSDIAEIRKLILGIKDTFTDVYPWYFFRPDWKSVITKNNSYESIYFKGLNITNYPRLNGDVLAVKMGDMDLSYNNSLQNTSSRSSLQTSSSIQYLLEYKNNETILKIFLNQEEKNIEGFQCELQLKSDCKIKSVSSTLLESDQYFIQGNTINLSVSTGEVLNFVDNVPFLILRLENNIHSCEVEDFLSFGQRIDNEYYTESGEIFELGLNLLQSMNSKLLQLVPNPFQDYLSFIKLSKADFLNVKIYNCNGVVLFNQSISGNEKLDCANWPAGIYYYYIHDSGNKLQNGSLIKF